MEKAKVEAALEAAINARLRVEAALRALELTIAEYRGEKRTGDGIGYAQYDGIDDEDLATHDADSIIEWVNEKHPIEPKKKKRGKK